jgi:hypothetical protein
MRYEPDRLWDADGFGVAGAERPVGEVRAVLARQGVPVGLYVRASRWRSRLVVVPLHAVTEIDADARTVRVDVRGIAELARASWLVGARGRLAAVLHSAVR